MGMPCFSKPLTLFGDKSNVTVHPQQRLENGHKCSEPPTKHEEFELPQMQYMPPPMVLEPSQDGTQRSPREKTAHPPTQQKQRLIVVCPSSTTETSTVTSTSRVSTPRSPVQMITNKVSKMFSGHKSTDHGENSTSKTKSAEFNRNSSKNSLIRRRSKSSLGRRPMIGGRARTPSVISDTSSMLCLSDGLAGLYALASLTAYETKLVPTIWKSCLEQNEYYSQHVLSRLFNKHPELEDMFIQANEKCGKSKCKREIIQEKSEMVMSYLDRLIMQHELDYERLLEECERLGRSHAVYYYERGLQPYHWDAFAISVVQEYRKTNMNVDMGTDEKELQQLAWTHFTTAVVSAIKESFEDELQRMTPTQDCGSNAGEKTGIQY